MNLKFNGQKREEERKTEKRKKERVGEKEREREGEKERERRSPITRCHAGHTTGPPASSWCLTGEDETQDVSGRNYIVFINEKDIEVF